MSATPAEPVPSTRRVASEAVIAGVAVVAAHLFLRLSAIVATGAYNDDGVYVAIGQSLASGSGYRLIYLVGSPVAVKFPPGLPAVLAAAWWATGSLTGVRAVIGVLQPLMVGTTAGLLWWLGRRRLGATGLSLAALSIGPLLLDPVIHYLNLALAEPEFMLGWASALVLAFPLLSEAREIPPGIGRPVALGVVLAATTLFRSIGVALILAVLIACAWRRRWRTCWITAVVALLPLVVWQAWHAQLIARGPISSLPDEAGYWRLLPLHAPLRLVGLFAATAWEHTLVYGRRVATYLLTPAPLGVTLIAGMGVLALMGAVRCWRERAVVTLSVALTLAATLVWPFAQERFALTVLPFVGLLAAAGLSRAMARFPARARALSAVVLVALAVAVGWRQRALRRSAGEAFVTRRRPDPVNVSPAWFLATNSRFIYEVSSWVRDHTQPDDRLLVDSPAGIFLYTGRRTMQASPAQSELEPPIFLVPGRYLASHIRADSISFAVVGHSGDLAADVRAVAERCPGVMTPADGRPLHATGFPRFLRITPDSTCLTQFLGPPAEKPGASSGRS